MISGREAVQKFQTVSREPTSFGVASVADKSGMRSVESRADVSSGPISQRDKLEGKLLLGHYHGRNEKVERQKRFS